MTDKTTEDMADEMARRVSDLYQEAFPLLAKFREIMSEIQATADLQVIGMATSVMMAEIALATSAPESAMGAMQQSVAIFYNGISEGKIPCLIFEKFSAPAQT